MINGFRVSAVIAAAGMSHRMGSNINKLFYKIEGMPVLAHTLKVFSDCELVDNIIIVTKSEDICIVKEDIVDRFNISKVSNIISGGSTRQESIKNALNILDDSCDIVISHDGARPFLRENTLVDALKNVVYKRAVVVGVPAKDTIKLVSDISSLEINLTPKRELLWHAQTPQIFFKDDLVKAYDYADSENIEATDDSSLVEKIGISVHMVYGTYDNIKITTPDDLVLANMLFKKGD